MAQDFTDFFSGTLLGAVLGGRSRNDKYTIPPDFYHAPFSMREQEQWVTINKNENHIYNTTAELKMVIDRLALMFSNGRWKHVNKDGDEIENSEFVKLLNNPNEAQSRNEFLTQWYVQRYGVYGNSFIYQPRASQLQETPTVLWNLSPSRMTIDRTGKIWDQIEISKMISSYTFKMEGDGQPDVKYDPNDIIQFSAADSDDPLLGRSPLESIRMAISNIRLAYGYQNVIMAKKGGLGVWSSDSKDQMGSMRLTEEEETDLAQQLLRMNGIGDQQNAITISRAALKFTPATFPTAELLLQETIDAGKKAIIDLYGANENMFAAGDSTFNNVQMGEQHAYQDTIFPQALDLGNGLSKRWGLLEKEEKLILDYDHLPILKGDEVKKAQIIERKARAATLLAADGFTFTQDEIVEIVGLQPEE